MLFAARRTLSSSSAAAAKGIDWSALSSKATSSAAKGEITRLAQLFMELESTSKSVSSTIAPIDFAQYKKTIKNAKVVEQFEKAYAGLKLENYVDTEAAKTDAKLAELSQTAKDNVAKSAARLAALEKVLADLYSKRTTKATTVDDVISLYPEIKVEIDAEAKKHEWSKGLSV